MNKKQFYYVIICALVFTISVVAFIVDYNATVCHAKGCNNDKTYGSERKLGLEVRNVQSTANGTYYCKNSSNTNCYEYKKFG